MRNKTTSAGGGITLAIIVPTYNESKNIAALFASIKRACTAVSPHAITVFVVDDSSPDGTAEIARAEAQKNTTKNLAFEILVKKKKEGLGKAYTWAFKKVLTRKQFDYLLEMDADLSHNPKYLRQFINAALGGNDVVVASRYIPGGGTPDWTWDRKFLSKFGNTYIRFFLGSKLTDWTGGYNMYKAALLKKIDLDSLPSGYSFQLTLKYFALQQTSAAAEIPIIFPDRTEGESKIPKNTIYETLALVPLLKASRVRKRFGGAIIARSQATRQRAGFFYRHRVIVVLAAIMLLGAFLRLYHLGSNVPALNQDEIVNGYDAYSLGSTLRDHRGNFLPLVLESFGDSVSVALTYITIPFVMIGGLTGAVVRLPVALAGIASIGLFFLFLRELTGRSKLALLGAFILAVAPWHITLSRWAIPPTIVPFFLLLFLWLFTCGVKRERATPYLLGAGAAGAAMAYSYPAAVVFAPAFVTVISLVYLWKYRQRLITLLGTFYILVAPLYALMLLAPQTNFRRFGSVSLGSSGSDLIVGISERFIEYFSPHFLFGPVGINPMMHVPGTGNMYHFFIYILVAAVCIAAFRFEQQTQKISYFVRQTPFKAVLVALAWAFFAILPAAVTKDHQHVTRVIAFWPLITLLITLATYYVITNFHRLRPFLLTAFTLISLFGVAGYFHTYTTSYRAVAAHTQFFFGVRESIDSIRERDAAHNYKQIVIDDSINQPYIYYLFYAPIQPANIDYNELNKNGYSVREIGKVKFVGIPEDVLHNATLVDSITGFDETWYQLYEKDAVLYVKKTGTMLPIP